MLCKNLGTSFFRFDTIHALERLTDGRPEMPSQYPALHYTPSRGKNSSRLLTKLQSYTDYLILCMLYDSYNVQFFSYSLSSSATNFTMVACNTYSFFYGAKCTAGTYSRPTQGSYYSTLQNSFSLTFPDKMNNFP